MYLILRFFLLTALFLTFLPGVEVCSAQAIRLYQTTRNTGSLQELDVNSGTILATNVGGITNGRGMAFSPVGGLFIANGNQISFLSDPLGSAVNLLTFAGETPHDVAFDSACNLYVVTNLNVHVYNSSFAPVLSFAHGVPTTTGDGNGNKGWSLAIRPDNGEIYVAGRNLNRFNPTTGAQVGTTLSGAPNGFAGIAFTPSNFNSVYFYLGYVISGVDQVRAYDVNVGFLRSFFPAHNGNPIDLEVHPLTEQLYLFNTVAANPTNSYSSSEVLTPGWNTAGNASRGSAIGFFSGSKLEQEAFHFGGTQVNHAIVLTWEVPATLRANAWLMERIGIGGRIVTIGKGNGSVEDMRLRDAAPFEGTNVYRLRWLDGEGATLREANAEFKLSSDAPEWALVQDADRHLLLLETRGGEAGRMRLRLMDLKGQELFRHSGTRQNLNIPVESLASGIYLLQVQYWEEGGMNPRSFSQKVLIH